jgi:anti-anti-sigma factor
MSSGTRAVPFTADCVRNADQILVRVAGRLVEPREPQPNWPGCLEQLSAADVRVDLAEVTQIDAHGVGMLAELTRSTRARGGHVAVVSASGRVRRILELARLDDLLEPRAGGPYLAA